MFLAQVPIRSHRQRASIGVTEPSRNGRYIHARLDAKGRKEVSKVVVGHPVATGFFCRARERLLRLTDTKNRVLRFWHLFAVQAFEKLLQGRNHRDNPVTGRRLLAGDRNHALLEVHVPPPQERALDEEIHDRDGDVIHQQAGDGFVDAAVVAEHADEAEFRAEQSRLCREPAVRMAATNWVNWAREGSSSFLARTRAFSKLAAGLR